MTVLIISDVHANMTALQAVVKDAGRVDEIWCAGDLVDYGTDPHEVLEWFRKHKKAKCVLGNHDKHLIQVYDSGETDRVRGTREYMWVHDNCDRITPEDVDYLRNLPVHRTLEADDGYLYLMQHQLDQGNGAYNMPESLQRFDEFWNEHCDKVMFDGCGHRMIFGHTHRRCMHILDQSSCFHFTLQKVWLNPGSVSYRRPDDNDKNAHYMLLDSGEIFFRSVEYDHSRSFARTMEHVKNGTMKETDLQDAMFYFGDAKTSRDPLPEL